MKKIYLLLAAGALLCGCVGMNYTDGDSTKQWLKIESSKSDMDGNITDVCYRLDLHFNPAEAITRIDTDNACITKCCWYSERKSVLIRFNDTFGDEMVKNAIAKKYAPDNVTFYISYSPFLDTIHGRISQKSVLRSDGLVTLQYTEVKDQERYLNVGGKEDLKPAKFEGDAHEGTYFFDKDIPEQQRKAQEQAKAAQEAAEKEKAEQQKLENLNMDDRDVLLQQKLKYERSQAVILVKRFYDQKIDSYIMNLDKEQRRKGLVLLTNDRKWITNKIGSPVYKVTCRVNGRLGKTQSDMEDYPIPCGVYQVDIEEKTVTPKDSLARSIVSGEYKN